MKELALGFGGQCPVCGVFSGTIFQKRRDVALLRCNECSLVFIPFQAYAADPASQYEHDETSPAHYYAATAAADRKNFKRTLRAIERYHRPGTILDIGASIGTFLEEARERGWHGRGVEPNPQAVDFAQKKRLDILRGFFDADAADFFRGQEPGGFDAVHMGDVVEHVFDPLALFRLARSLMKPDGVLAVVTPDIDRLLARKYQIKPREHLLYFNSLSLKHALEISGFEVLEMHSQARIRDVSNMGSSTVVLSALERKIASLARLPAVQFLLNAIFWVFRDELVALVRPKRYV